ncbi:MAG: Flavohemoprotein [Chroococcopsis gigantea SAG 12.99]|jgi:ferredoxin-NADP reductase|nr:Flavohemoprotein [Chroococcopsis gigantea SAG 12.99]
MFSELGKISDRRLRSLTFSLSAGAAIAFAGAIIMGVTAQKNENAYKIAVYSSLLAMGGGAFLGSATGKKFQPVQTILPDATTWQDWRNFIVSRKIKESEEITSFYLQPQDGQDLSSFSPGQFLTIKLDILGQTKPVIRTYSLSDYQPPFKHYRVSIKKEPAPQGLDVMPGLASNFLHDTIQEGSVISVKPPSGKFILYVEHLLPAVLVSNGVGITPMISMAKAITKLNQDRPVWFFHGARDGSFHAFRDEMKALAAQNPNLNLHFAYSRPRPEDEGHYHSVGYVDTDLIQASLGQREAEYFLCGSPSFMDSIRTGLKNLGVQDESVSFEMFTKAKKSTTKNIVMETSRGEGTEIFFERSGKKVIWGDDEDNILEFAEANGLNPPYSCRQGICGTCECRILDGEVEYQVKPIARVESGSVLICISKPKGEKIVLDL